MNYIGYKNSVLISLRTYSICAIKTSRQATVREVFPTYCENLATYRNRLDGQVLKYISVRKGGTYIYRWALSN